MIQFHYNTGPNSMKIALFLEESGLSYDAVPVDTRKGDEYTLVDMSVWGWARLTPVVLGPDSWSKLPNVKRWLDEINARPAAQRAEALKTRHAFKTEMDDEARRAIFPQNERLAG